jgi:hypothetical protein
MTLAEQIKNILIHHADEFSELCMKDAIKVIKQHGVEAKNNDIRDTIISIFDELTRPIWLLTKVNGKEGMLYFHDITESGTYDDLFYNRRRLPHYLFEYHDWVE